VYVVAVRVVICTARVEIAPPSTNLSALIAESETPISFAVHRLSKTAKSLETG